MVMQTMDTSVIENNTMRGSHLFADSDIAY